MCAAAAQTHNKRTLANASTSLAASLSLSFSLHTHTNSKQWHNTHTIRVVCALFCNKLISSLFFAAPNVRLFAKSSGAKKLAQTERERERKKMEITQDQLSSIHNTTQHNTIAAAAAVGFDAKTTPFVRLLLCCGEKKIRLQPQKKKKKSERLVCAHFLSFSCCCCCCLTTSFGRNNDDDDDDARIIGRNLHLSLAAKLRKLLACLKCVRI